MPPLSEFVSGNPRLFNPESETMKLLIESTSPENPTVAVRWCLNKAEREALISVKEQVFVLIVIAYEKGAEDRFLCRLEEAMTHLVFRFAGKHKVFSRLVWRMQNETDQTMEAAIMQRKDANSFHAEVLRYERDGLNSFISHTVSQESHALELAETLDVEVDAGHFAPEPPQWLKEWVNMMFRTPPRDQCEFRKRMIYAFTVQPLLALIFWLVYTVAAVISLLVGASLLARGLHLRSLWVGNDDGWVWRKVHVGWEKRVSFWSLEDEKGNRKPWRLLVTPLVLGIEAVTLEYFHRQTGMGYYELLQIVGQWVLGKAGSGLVALWAGLLVNLSYLFIAIGVAAVLLVVVVLFAWYAAREALKRKELEASPDLKKLEEERLETSRRMERERVFEYLTCSTSMVPSVKALPPKRQTFRLRFQDFKRDVCRPYAK